MLWGIVAAGLTLNLVVAVIPVKISILLAAALLLVAASIISPFTVLILLVLAKISNVLLPSASVGFLEVGAIKIIGGLLVVILIVNAISKRDFFFLRPPQTTLLLCFVLLAFTSSLFSGEFGVALTQSAEYASSFFIFLLIAGLVNSKRMVKAVILILILSGVLMIFLEVLAMKGVIGFRELPYWAESYRFGWFYAQPNELAIHLSVLIPLVFYSIIRFKSWIMKVLMACILLSFSVSIFWTASRSGLLTFMFAWALIISRNAKSILVWVALASLLVGVIVLIPSENLERLSSTRTVFEGRDSPVHNIALRFEFIRLGFRIFTEDPLLGAGPGNYNYRIMEYGFEPKAAHNAYVSVLAEMGVIGFLIYLLAYIVSYTNFRTARKMLVDAGPELSNISESLLLAFAVFAVGQMAHVAAFSASLATFIGLSVVLKKIAVTPLCGSPTHKGQQN